jgi:malate dehydrogenase (oxaloacetate-decarboxylating)(NADP+)
MVNQDRNVFGASMVAHGHADAMVTGVTRSFGVNHEYITRVLDTKPGQRLMTCSLVVTRNNALFIADTNITEVPEPEVLADIAVQTATKARAFGYEPRVALVSFSNFGYPHREHMQRIQEATMILDVRKVDFEYDGEMGVDVALDMSLRKNYPFCRLSGPANILIMPGLHAANISYKLLQAVGGGTIIGPMLLGLEKPVQIVQMNATVNDLVQAAAIAAHDTILTD